MTDWMWVAFAKKFPQVDVWAAITSLEREFPAIAVHPATNDVILYP